MVDGTRAKCRDCGGLYTPSKIQEESTDFRKCRQCVIEECDHERTGKLRQSGKRYCLACGYVVDSGQELKSLTAW